MSRRRGSGQVFDIVRRSFAPVAASFEYDRDRWRPGETFRCGLWAINDRWEPVAGARLGWRIDGPSGSRLAGGEWPAPMGSDSARKIGEVTWKAAAPGAYQLRAALTAADGSEISENVFEFEVR